MNKPISVIEILNVLDDDYVLLKKRENFPEYTPGSDIDLLVIDRQWASRRAQNYLIKRINANETILRISEGKKHTHIDICEGKNIILRIDLVDEFDFFTKFSIQGALKTKIFMTRVAQKVGDFKVFTPSLEFDLLIRYLEYIEWFERRPDKIKHLDYILSHADDEQRDRLIENVHRYIRLHHDCWQGKVPAKKGMLMYYLKKIWRLIKKYPKKVMDLGKNKLSK